MFRKIISILAAHLFGCAVFAQGSIDGTLADWTYGSAEVYTGLMTPMNVGSINDAGSFEILLKPDYLAEIQKQMEEENSDPDRKWSSSMMTIAESFNCYSDGVSFENGDQPLSSLSTMGFFMLASMEKQQRFGDMMPASSQEFVAAFRNLGSYTFKEGYSLDWYYVDEAAGVKGSCTVNSGTLSGEMYDRTVHYDLDFKKGWNLVKYEVAKIFTDKDGKTYIENDHYTTISELPSDLKFVFIPE